MTKDEALTLALEALKQIDEAMPFPVAKLAQKAIKEALAQPEQEPVLCQYAIDIAMPEYRCAGKCQYTNPQQRPWVGLTDDEVIAASAIATYMDDLDAWTFARAIEAKLKEKNT